MTTTTSSVVTQAADRGAGVIGSGGFAAFGGEFACVLQVDEAFHATWAPRCLAWIT